MFSQSRSHSDVVLVGEMFRLHRERCGSQIEAVCQLLTHGNGWEARLEVSGSVQRSDVRSSQDDVLAVADEWKASMVQNGWR